MTVSHGYGFQIGAFLLDTGVAQSGTWWWQISNSNTTAGTPGSLSFSRIMIDDTIDLGGSAATGAAPNKPRLYLVRPGTATAVAYKLTVVPAAPRSAPPWSPMGAMIDGSVTTGRVLAHPPLLLPIARCMDSLVQRSHHALSATAPEVLPPTPISPPPRRWRRGDVRPGGSTAGRSAMEHGAGIDARDSS